MPEPEEGFVGHPQRTGTSEQAPGMKNRKGLVSLLFKILISALLIALVLRKVDLDGILSSLRDVGWWYVAGSTVPFSLSLFVLARRWQALSSGLLTFPQALRYTWVGVFYGAILPGTFSGDVAKCASLALKHDDARLLALPVSVAMDRIIGLYTLLVLFALSCLLLALGACGEAPALLKLGRNGFVYSTVAVVAATLVAAFPAARKLVGDSILRLPFARVREGLRRFCDAAFGLLTRPSTVLSAMALSFVSHGLNMVYTYCLVRALGLDMAFAPVFVFYSLLSVALIVSISYCGIGIRDVVSIAFFQAITEPGRAAIAFSWLSVVVVLAMAAVGGIVLAWELGDAKKGVSEFLGWRAGRARKERTE